MSVDAWMVSTSIALFIVAMFAALHWLPDLIGWLDPSLAEEDFE